MTDQAIEDLPAVIAELEEKCQEFPSNVMARHHLGLVYLKAGRTQDAIESLEKAIALDPQSVESLINLGAIHFGQGDLDKAADSTKGGGHQLAGGPGIYKFGIDRPTAKRSGQGAGLLPGGGRRGCVTGHGLDQHDLGVDHAG